MIPALLLIATVETSTSAVEGPDPLRYAKYAALFDGGWSIALTAGWALSARSWDAPHAEGIIGIASARILYGTTWSILLATEVALARALAGEEWGGISQGRFKNNWLVGFEVPGDCDRRERSGGPGGSWGSCGGGLGSFGEVSAQVTRGTFPIRVALTGGWIQGRYLQNQELTLIESTWVQAPVGVWFEPRLALGPIALEVSVGPNFLWGMHNAHIHPRAGASISVPVHEIIPLHFGVGPGAHARLSLVFFDAVAVDAEADVGALVLGGSNEGATPLVAPLDAFRDRGVPLWRKAALSLRFTLDALHPLEISARVFACELSPGRLDKVGHLAGGIQFQVPIELDEE